MVSTGIHGLAGVPIPDIEAEYNQECVKFFGTRLGCDHIFSPYTYDAVWHYAVLLHKYLIDEGHAYEDLNTLNSQEGLFNLSLEADFLGLTGRVRHFNGIDPAREDSHGSIGDRDGPTLIRQIRGSTGDALITVGHRLPDQGWTWSGYAFSAQRGSVRGRGGQSAILKFNFAQVYPWNRSPQQVPLAFPSHWFPDLAASKTRYLAPGFI